MEEAHRRDAAGERLPGTGSRWDRRVERAGIAEQLTLEGRLANTLEGLANEALTPEERRALRTELAVLMLAHLTEQEGDTVVVDYVPDEPIEAQLN